MVPWRATPDGQVTPELVSWYGRFADGAPGAVVVEATGIRDVPSGPLLRINEDRFVPGLRALPRVITERSHGRTQPFIQLIDYLRIRRRPPRERFLREFLAITPALRHRLGEVVGGPGWPEAPETQVRARLAQLDDEALRQVLSGREWEALERGARQRVTDTETPEVRDLPQTLPVAFAAAAARAVEAGFTGVELHFAHGYTMASFLSALNHRDDGYGRTREGRVRLAREVLAAVRARLSREVVIGCRLLADEIVEGGSRVDDASWFAVALARAGADFVSLSVGGKFEDARQPRVGEAAYPYTGPSGLACMPHARLGAKAPGLHLPLARTVRQALRAAGLETPVVAAGGLHTFGIAEQALARGDLDIVAAGRQSLADPEWWEKLRTGRGAEVRRCSMTNYCEGLDQRHKPVTCRLWDRLGVPPGQRRRIAP